MVKAIPTHGMEKKKEAGISVAMASYIYHTVLFLLSFVQFKISKWKI